MRKIVLLAFCLIAFVFALQAQDGRGESIVYLKNGRVVKGYIIKKELGTVSILVLDSVTNSKKTQVYQQTEIKK